MLAWEPGSEYFRFTDLAAAQFVRGGWLEDYAYHAVHDAGVHDARLGVEGTWDHQEAMANEFDVLACHMNQLLHIECKTLRYRDENDNAIAYKLDSLGDDVRGLFGHTWLLSAREPTETADQTSVDATAWSQRIHERRTALRALAAERKAREQQRAEAAAREAQAEQAKAERRANLSPEALQLEALRERLAEDRAAGRKEKGGELANQLLEVLKAAEQQWTGPDCAELADLAEEIHGYIGWPAKQKKQARQALIAAIRDKA